MKILRGPRREKSGGERVKGRICEKKHGENSGEASEKVFELFKNKQTERGGKDNRDQRTRRASRSSPVKITQKGVKRRFREGSQFCWRRRGREEKLSRGYVRQHSKEIILKMSLAGIPILTRETCKGKLSFHS